MAFRHVVKRFFFSSPEIKKFVFRTSGYNKYGLLHDDCLDEDDEDVQEALRRLPEDMLHQRTYRILRAFQLAVHHDILPKEEWIEYEEDVRYLQPILEQVIAERKEREEWEASH